MKLYLWRDVLCNYREGVAFALANSIEEARALIISTAEGNAFTEETMIRDLAAEPEIIESSFGFHLWGGD